MNKFYRDIRSILCLLNILLLIIGLSSCSKEKTYQIIIVNETDYYLNNVTIGRGDNALQIEVGPNQSSVSYEIKHKSDGISLSRPFMWISVLTYSDSATTYENSGSTMIAMSEFNEGRTNYVHIELAPPNTGVLNQFSATLK